MSNAIHSWLSLIFEVWFVRVEHYSIGHVAEMTSVYLLAGACQVGPSEIGRTHCV